MKTMEISHEYYSLIQEALDSVRHKQHLRWIGYFFRTRQVCLEALKSDLDNFNDCSRNIYWIPIPIIDIVIEELEKIARYSSKIPELRKIANNRKEKAAKDPNYYDENGKTFEEILKEYETDTFEKMLYIRFTRSRSGN